MNMLKTLLLMTLIFTVSATAFAQRTDHLTKEEIEILRNVQDLDNRMEVYEKAIDRRFLAIKGSKNLSSKQLKQIEKDSEHWGELPKGDFSRLVLDIEKILDEAIDKIDDVAQRNRENVVLPYAIHDLADYSRDLIPRVQKLMSNAKNEDDKGSLATTIESCNQVIEASKQVPKPKGKLKKVEGKRY